MGESLQSVRRRADIGVLLRSHSHSSEDARRVEVEVDVFVNSHPHAAEDVRRLKLGAIVVSRMKVLVSHSHCRTERTEGVRRVHVGGI